MIYIVLFMYVLGGIALYLLQRSIIFPGSWTQGTRGAKVAPTRGQELIDRLPDHYKVVLLLRDLEGLSNEETADVLGESVVAIKSRLHRARMALREDVTHSPTLGYAV